MFSAHCQTAKRGKANHIQPNGVVRQALGVTQVVIKFLYKIRSKVVKRHIGITIFCKCKISKMFQKYFVFTACAIYPKSTINLFLIVGQELVIEFEKGYFSTFHTEKGVFKFSTVYSPLILQNFGIAFLNTRTNFVKFPVWVLCFSAFT